MQAPLHYDLILKSMPFLSATLQVAQDMEEEALHKTIFQAFSDTLTRFEVLSLAYFERSSRQTFVLGPWFQTLLEHTSLEVLDETYEVHLPYKGFYISLPEFEGKVWSQYLKKHLPLRGLYVFQLKSAPVICLFFWGQEEGPMNNCPQGAVGGLAVDLSKAYMHPQSLFGYLTEAVTTLSESFRFGCLFWESKKPDVTTRQSVLKAATIAFNLIYYLSMEKTETRHITRRNRRRERLMENLEKSNPTRALRIQKEMTQMPRKMNVTYVGESYEQNKAKAISPTSGGRPSPKQHWVRGHYRTYQKGPQGKTRFVRMWIKPFLRGDPVLGTVDQRMYKVGGEKKLEES